jgi:hypothetical protein
MAARPLDGASWPAPLIDHRQHGITRCLDGRILWQRPSLRSKVVTAESEDRVEQGHGVLRDTGQWPLGRRRAVHGQEAKAGKEGDGCAAHAQVTIQAVPAQCDTLMGLSLAASHPRGG